MLAEVLTGGPPLGWGTAEPVTRPWRRRELTAFARGRAPEPSRIVVVGGLRPLQGVVEVERTASGVEETVTTYVGYSSGEAPPVVALEEGLARLAAECTVVSMFATWAPGHRDLLHEPRWCGTPTPVLLALGPEAPGGTLIHRFAAGESAAAWTELDDLLTRLQVPDLLIREDVG